MNKPSTLQQSHKLHGMEVLYDPDEKRVVFHSNNISQQIDLLGAIMKNVEFEVKGNILTIKVDLSKTFGTSTSGKSIMVASSMGNQQVAPGIMAGINVYKVKKKDYV